MTNNMTVIILPSTGKIPREKIIFLHSLHNYICILLHNILWKSSILEDTVVITWNVFLITYLMNFNCITNVVVILTAIVSIYLF